MLCSNTLFTEFRNRSSMCRSRANALTILMPEMLSSAPAVTSPTRCCTSCSAGRFRRLYRVAVATRKGTGAKASSASTGSSTNIAVAAKRMVRALWLTQIRPYPRKNRIDCRSTVARDISWPVCCESKNPSSSFCRCS